MEKRKAGEACCVECAGEKRGQEWKRKKRKKSEGVKIGASMASLLRPISELASSRPQLDVCYRAVSGGRCGAIRVEGRSARRACELGEGW